MPKAIFAYKGVHMVFDNEIIVAIEVLVEKIKEDNQIVNAIIRDDVFSILQDCCTVLYYPLEGEEDDGCAGCHLEKVVNEKMEQFVFINTINTRERQAFSAAHELGHIWKVDEYIKKQFPDKEVDGEEVVNKFAAELLMPRKYFKKEINNQLERMGYKGPNIEMAELVRLIAYLMNYFFVPYKAVVLRLNEIGRLRENDNEMVFKYKDSALLNEIIKAEQYTRLRIVNKLKSMDNLQEYLQRAEEEKLFSDTKIQNIRADFGIEDIKDTDMNKVQF